MIEAYHRAVAIVIHNEHILLIRRYNGEKTYYVFPGGHVEPREDVIQAALRETLEETSIHVEVDRLLYRYLYDDGRVMSYLLCRYLSGEPRLSEDAVEVNKINQRNTYEPCWLSLTEFANSLVYPLEVRDAILEDRKTNFAQTPREERVVFAELRQSL